MLPLGPAKGFYQVNEEFGASWIELPAEDTDIQHGAISANEDELGMHRGSKDFIKSIWIPFATRYQDDPQVVCWITMIDSNMHHNHRLKVYPTDTSRDGAAVQAACRKSYQLDASNRTGNSRSRGAFF